MTLFDELERSETRGKYQNEPSFSYHNSSARPMVAAIRDLLESWFSNFPSEEQLDLRNRFRRKSEDQHLGAFTELYWHELLIKLGYKVQVHPNIAGAETHPDFLATASGKVSFYLEAKVSMPPSEQGADKRLFAVHDLINTIKSPDFFLNMDYEGAATDNLNGRALKATIRRWIESLNYDDVQQNLDKSGHETLPSLSIAEHGLSLTFSAQPKGPETRGKCDIPTVGVSSPEAMWLLKTHRSIRSAVEAKAKKYGLLNDPLVIAINVMDIFCDQSAIWDALLGDEQVVATRQADGTWKHEWGARASNGAWRGRDGRRNKQVSAVIVTDSLIPTTLRRARVQLIHNPWAENPLPVGSLPFTSYIPKIGHFQKEPGVEAADVLGIPNPWPVQED